MVWGNVLLVLDLGLDVVDGVGGLSLELLSGGDQALLVWGNVLLVLDLRLDVVDSVGGLDLVVC